MLSDFFSALPQKCEFGSKKNREKILMSSYGKKSWQEWSFKVTPTVRSTKQKLLPFEKGKAGQAPPSSLADNTFLTECTKKVISMSDRAGLNNN